MADTERVKSKREQMGERLKTKYPDKEYADDEALFGQINDDYDQYENELKGLRDNERKLTGMFSEYPHSARFISDMANGINPWVAMVEQLGMDGITDIFDNPQYKEELAKAQAEHQKRLAQGKELEEQYNANLGESLKMLETEQQAQGLTDEQIDAAIDLLMQIANDAIVGKFTKESLDMAMKALNHEGDVEQARAEGEVAGRNAKVAEKLRKPTRGDGTPQLAGSNNAPSRKVRKGSIFDLAAEANS